MAEVSLAALEIAHAAMMQLLTWQRESGDREHDGSRWCSCEIAEAIQKVQGWESPIEAVVDEQRGDHRDRPTGKMPESRTSRIARDSA